MTETLKSVMMSEICTRLQALAVKIAQLQVLAESLEREGKA